MTLKFKFKYLLNNILVIYAFSQKNKNISNLLFVNQDWKKTIIMKPRTRKKKSNNRGHIIIFYLIQCKRVLARFGSFTCVFLLLVIHLFCSNPQQHKLHRWPLFKKKIMRWIILINVVICKKI